jgi:hypothetical protein
MEILKMVIGLNAFCEATSTVNMDGRLVQYEVTPKLSCITAPFLACLRYLSQLAFDDQPTTDGLS